MVISLLADKQYRNNEHHLGLLKNVSDDAPVVELLTTRVWRCAMMFLNLIIALKVVACQLVQSSFAIREASLVGGL